MQLSLPIGERPEHTVGSSSRGKCGAKKRKKAAFVPNDQQDDVIASLVRTKNVLHCWVQWATFCIDVQESHMLTEIYRVPRLAETANGDVVVTHWGHAAGTLFRGGDRLIFGEDEKDGLLVLSPKGWGNPMFGRRDGVQLLALPSGAPASNIRWSIFGAVQSVERDFERGGIGGSDRWFVTLRFESSDLTSIAKARTDFEGGWVTSAELDTLCRRAAVAPETHGVAIAIAAGGSAEQAAAMVADVAVGRLRFQTRPVLHETVEQGVVVEGPWAHIRDAARHWTETGSDSRRVAARRRVAAGGTSRVQLSLFGDTAPIDG